MRAVIRCAGGLWLVVGALSLARWFGELIQRSGSATIVNVPLVSLLMVISGAGVLLLARRSGAWIRGTAILSVALSSFVGGLFQLRLDFRAIPDVLFALAYLSIFNLAAVRRVFDSPANQLRLTDDQIYGGNRWAKGLGAISALLLGLTLVAVWWDWRLGVSALAGALITSLAGYWLSEGRNNPGLVESAWTDKTKIDLVGDATGTWEAKVMALFSLLEKDFPGRYAEALDAIKLRSVPAEVYAAYETARQNPSRETWLQLKAAMLANAPGRQSQGGHRDR